ncbi:MAG: L,D-transpeptidase family protein [Telluria sp.]
MRPLAWLENGQAQARVALRLLQDAPRHGLDPADYGAEELARRLDAAASETPAAIERDLTAAMLRYLADLHRGRIPPDHDLPDPVPAFDPAPSLARALDERRLEEAVDAAAPALPLYRRVQATLAEYRALADSHPHWAALPPLPRGGISPGSRYAGAGLLRERLQILGDLDAGDPDDGSASARAYTGTDAAALRRFQSRHGLAEDGVLGRGTLAALSVPLAHRVVQLELTLERLRWLPPLPPGRTIIVNVPGYRLWTFDSRDAGPEPVLEMRIIVGNAAKTPTPLFVGQMRHLEFNPFWNVPRSITVNEIIPKLARNPSWLRQNDMELVSAGGKVVAGPLASLRAGTVRVRQRPGPRNALGRVKFGMPNPLDIYLHSTPSQELFARARRDLSHGCIRVEHPSELAQFVLADPEKWNIEAVTAAMRPGRQRTVSLPQPVPVVLLYATAITGRAGRALFADDIYKRDEKLIQALRAR